MPRNAEVIRQWKILRTLEASRHGESVASLAKQCDVTERTIWRDVAALQEVGFPLIDEKRDGHTRWKMMPHGLKGLADSGLSISVPQAHRVAAYRGARTAAGENAVLLGVEPANEGVSRRAVSTSYAQGGMYLLAQVPKYHQLRTFAVERIKSLSVTTQTFAAPEARKLMCTFASGRGIRHIRFGRRQTVRSASR